METLDFPQKPSEKDALKNLLFLALTIGFLYFVTVKVGVDNIQETVSAAGIYAPLVVIFLKATTLVIVPLGGAPLYPIAGLLFGFFPGLLVTLIGDIVGSTVAFYISRVFGRSILKFFMSREHHPMIERLITHMGEKKTFVRAKIFFVGFPELFAYAAGLTPISYLFFITVHISIHAVSAALLVAFGDVLVSGNILAIVGVTVVTSLLAVSGAWYFYRDVKKPESE